MNLFYDVCLLDMLHSPWAELVRTGDTYLKRGSVWRFRRHYKNGNGVAVLDLSGIEEGIEIGVEGLNTDTVADLL